MRKLAQVPDHGAPPAPARGQRIRPKAATSSDREYVQGFERGVSVIKTFGAKRPHLTVTEVAAQTGLSRAVARRYLLTLERLGYVTATGPYYALTPRVLEIGFAYMSTMTVAEVARPFMAHVVDTLHESCSVGVLDGYDVFYVARTNPQRIMTTNLAIGSRLPAHATAMGHVLLAYLPPPALEAYLAECAAQRPDRPDDHRHGGAAPRAADGAAPGVGGKRRRIGKGRPHGGGADLRPQR